MGCPRCSWLPGDERLGLIFTGFLFFIVRIAHLLPPAVSNLSTEGIGKVWNTPTVPANGQQAEQPC